MAKKKIKHPPAPAEAKPRTKEDVLNEFRQLCLQSGELIFRISVMQKNINTLNERKLILDAEFTKLHQEAQAKVEPKDSQTDQK